MIKFFFKWRDYSDSNKQKVMALHAHEFMRRFLLHILPDKFVKIRHYGLLGNRSRKKLLDICREILKVDFVQHVKKVKTWQEKLYETTGIDVTCCPSCCKGKMIHIQELLPVRNNSP